MVTWRPCAYGVRLNKTLVAKFNSKAKSKHLSFGDRANCHLLKPFENEGRFQKARTGKHRKEYTPQRGKTDGSESEKMEHGK